MIVIVISTLKFGVPKCQWFSYVYLLLKISWISAGGMVHGLLSDKEVSVQVFVLTCTFTF